MVSSAWSQKGQELGCGCCGKTLSRAYFQSYISWGLLPIWRTYNGADPKTCKCASKAKIWYNPLSKQCRLTCWNNCPIFMSSTECLSCTPSCRWKFSKRSQFQIPINGENWENTLDIPYPSPIFQSLAHCSLVPCTTKDKEDEIGNYFSHHFALHPTISPEFGHCPIPGPYQT